MATKSETELAALMRVDRGCRFSARPNSAASIARPLPNLSHQYGLSGCRGDGPAATHRATLGVVRTHGTARQAAPFDLRSLAPSYAL